MSGLSLMSPKADERARSSERSSGQITHAKRAPRHEADAKLFAGRLFGIAANHRHDLRPRRHINQREQRHAAATLGNTLDGIISFGWASCAVYDVYLSLIRFLSRTAKLDESRRRSTQCSPRGIQTKQ
jgi:hypothetical protein